MLTHIYDRITQFFVKKLEQGRIPWIEPWQMGGITKPQRHNGLYYKGINRLLLSYAAIEDQYPSPFWLTFKQVDSLKGKVKRGEHGYQIIYYDTFKKNVQSKDGEDEEKLIPFIKTYTVFNAAQTQGLPKHYYTQPDLAPKTQIQKIDEAEKFVKNTGASVVEGRSAAYNGMADKIYMPPMALFKSTEYYYAALNHELTHWTKHPTRLDRDLGRKNGGMQVMQPKSWLHPSAQVLFANLSVLK